MCGIVGYLGNRRAKDVLISGLKRLDYICYDTAGIATILLDISYRPVSKQYIFSWIYSRDGSTLGEHLERKHFSNNNYSIKNLVLDYIDNSERIAIDSYDYSVK